MRLGRSGSHQVAGVRVRSRLQGEGRLVDQYVPLGGGGPQGLSGRGACDPSTLAAAVGQQGQLTTQDVDRNIILIPFSSETASQD